MAIVPAGSPAYPDVFAAYQACHDGDTLTIPRGPATWGPGGPQGVEQFLSVAKAIQIIGFGTDKSLAIPRGTNATIITNTNTSGKFISTTYPVSGIDFTSRISGIVIEVTTVGTGYLLSLQGKAYRHRDVSNNIVGGLRVDDIRIRNTADTARTDYTLGSTTSTGTQTWPLAGNTLNVSSTTGFKSSGQLSIGPTDIRVTYTGISGGNSFTGCTGGPATGSIAPTTSVTQFWPIANGAKLISWGVPDGGPGNGVYVTGSFDHNYIDFMPGSTGSESSNVACNGSPNGGLADGQGAYIWSQDYTYGGADDNSEFQRIYLEDNIFHKGGFSLGTLGGGARIIARHNTAWGGINGHGMESGGNMGTASWEVYNNNLIQVGTFATAAFNWRGGAIIHHSNRITGYGGNGQPPEIALQISRPSCSNSAVVGNGSGRNFFDENYKGNQTFQDANGGNVNFAPTSTVADARIGDVYASGNGCTVNSLNNFTLTGLDGTKGGQSQAGGVWNGFCLINTSTATPESQGEQGKNTGANNNSYALILTSDNNASNCRVTVEGGGNGNINLLAGNQWEIRRVKTFFCVPGSGKVSNTPGVLFGGNNLNLIPNNVGNADITGAQFSAANLAGQHKYWAGQFGFGCWQFGNLVRSGSGIPWASASPFSVNATSVVAKGVPGGVNNNAIPPYRNNNGTGGGSYPVAPGNDANYRRVGADWNGAGYSEQINAGDPGEVTQAYGLVYPNAMVATTVVPAPVINSPLTASATIGTPFSYTITATNSPTSYGATSLPSGLGVNGSTGVISGTPDGQPGDFIAQLSASNTGGTDTQPLDITVAGIVPTGTGGKRGKGHAHRISTAARRM